MKSNVRKLVLILILTIFFLLCMAISKEVFAKVLPEIPNVKITSDGIITWDEVEGTTTYWLGFDNSYLPAASGDNIKLRAGENPEKVLVHLEAYDGEKYLADWRGYIRYDSGYQVTNAYVVQFFEEAEYEWYKDKIVEGGTKVEKPEDPTRGGLIFKGWYLDKKFKNKFDFNTPITKSIELYAKWNEEYLNTFSDVLSTSWYYGAVKFVFEENIMKGLEEYKFGPNNKLTRSMMASILYNMEENPTVSGTSPFSDVTNTSAWYYKAVLWASQNKIVSGNKDGTFKPNGNITREELAIMLYNYAKFKGKDMSKTDDLSKFSDKNKVASYALTAVKWAVANNVITGSNGKLNPKGTATRAETASMIYKYCDKVGR